LAMARQPQLVQVSEWPTFAPAPLRWATFACNHERRLERETGFEPATSTLARSHSTTELFPPATTTDHIRWAGESRPCSGQVLTSRNTWAASSGEVGLR